MKANSDNIKGFTLIELLIVVAIIAILAAIAVPNFLEAQTRAKVSRVKADMRSLATAIEAYRVDGNSYPSANSEGTVKWLKSISTPVAYITSAELPDPFTEKNQLNANKTRNHIRYYGVNEMSWLNANSDDGHVLYSNGTDTYAAASGSLRVMGYLLFSHGPDRERNNLSGTPSGTFLRAANLQDMDNFVHYIYDPTNGTVSNGEIFRSGGQPTGETADVIRMTM